MHVPPQTCAGVQRAVLLTGARRRTEPRSPPGDAQINQAWCTCPAGCRSFLIKASCGLTWYCDDRPGTRGAQ